MHNAMLMASNLKVVLGTAELGMRGLAKDQPCFEVLNSFLERGYSEIDTALMYTEGKSEQVLGHYLTSKDASKVSVATKVNPWDENGLKRENVLEQVHTSLSNLQTSCIDILYLHGPDRNTPLEETLSACQQLHCENKFTELGLSNFAAWEVADIYHICKQNGWVLPTVYQGMYNAITRMVESELFPALRYFGLRFYAYNPLACGLLTGKYKYSDLEAQPEGRFFSDPKWSPVYRKQYWRESTFSGLELVRNALDDVYGVGKVSLISAAFRWLNYHSQLKPEHNDAIIIGGSKMEHMITNLDACEEGPLDERVVKAFSEAWQLDKGNCPKYYY